MTGLFMIVADATQSAVNCRDGEAVNQIDDVTRDRFGRGGQRTALVFLTPGAEVFPVGSIGVKGVFRVAMGDVGTRSRQEIFDGCG